LPTVPNPKIPNLIDSFNVNLCRKSVMMEAAYYLILINYVI